MRYPYQNLDPEQFQQFVQSLLIQEFKGLQCFPVAQPDGGRDAIAYIDQPKDKSFIMFQVKFIRDTLTPKEQRDWLKTTLKKELPKIKKQILKGAKRYILITNISGTAHSGSGSIDIVNDLLQKYIPIPSQCWWADDLDRRLDNAWNLKWSYPQLMTGPDLLRSLIESGFTESKERRLNTLKAYIIDQFANDEEVRFKQVELQNKLLDLFIDVPIQLSTPNSSKKRNRIYNIWHTTKLNINNHRHEIEEAVLPNETSYLFNEYHDKYDDKTEVGAATLLLSSKIQTELSNIVLEGAPGQGKSTITQYICQVHRMHLLKDNQNINKLPKSHQNISVRIPFRIDLRDYATWLSQRNPFSADQLDPFPISWKSSLETFLAAHISHYSGGGDFTYDDLLATIKVSSILVILDGLDEVADIKTRKEVVTEIVKGVKRLSGNAASLQIIITSRPTAFANSPGLPESTFTYCQLGSVTRTLIESFAQKWIHSRRLHKREANDVKRILREKLDQPHIRDLSRNPMQLTILLSLIHTRGSSLPDKRTALYDSYVELFFNREAEKSIVVRDYRDLLVNIHRYLAWILHTSAESKNGNGSITTERLQEMLKQYLSNEGHDSNLADELFTGMVERVVALVSRVEGTYEFEVQPLREYFAARFLYETAPYSPTGKEVSGTRPDRFDVIARNFFWLNVTRFYAGCYSKGELSSIIDSLQNLVEDKDFGLTSHPRVLAATLLSDWVFSQAPKRVGEVIQLIVDGIGLRYILASRKRQIDGGMALILPDGCGRINLLEHCSNLLMDDLPVDYAYELTELIKQNALYEELINIWLDKIVGNNQLSSNRQLEIAYRFGILSQINLETINQYFPIESLSPSSINFLIGAHQISYFEQSDIHFKAAVDAILSNKIPTGYRHRPSTILEQFSMFLGALQFNSMITGSHRPLVKVWKILEYNIDSEPIQSSFVPDHELQNKCQRTIDIIRKEAQKFSHLWVTTLDPWDNVIEILRAEWGDRWIFWQIATISAGIRSKSESCKEFDNLFDTSTSLCRRVRYARLRAGNRKWWIEQFQSAKTEEQQSFLILILLSWGSPSTITDLIVQIDEIITCLTEQQWIDLYISITDITSNRDNYSNSTIKNINRSAYKSFPKLNIRTVTLLTSRTGDDALKDIYIEYISSYNGTNRAILYQCYEISIKLLLKQEIEWREFKEKAKEWFRSGFTSYTSTHWGYRISEHRMPIIIAKEIASHAKDFPAFLVTESIVTITQHVGQQVKPVIDHATKDSWSFS